VKNTLLVTVDSLRHDRVTERVMPRTAAFADGALDFADAVANGPSTPASFPAILASRHFASIDGLGIPRSGGGVVTLAERLSAAGYATAGFTDNHFASGDYHYGRGFDHLHDASGLTEAGRLKQFVQSNLDKDGPLFRTIEAVYNRVDGLYASATGQKSEYERAASLNDRALSWIAERDGPWFVWLHYMDVHHPYEAPAAYQRRFCDDVHSVTACRRLSRRATHHSEELTDDEWALLADLYDAECAYVDDQFDALLAALDDRGLREETVTLFTADHGELLGEHGEGGHPPEFWEPVVRVPFLLDGAGRTGVHDGQVRLLDVAPTFADALGLDPAPEWRGESALALDDGEGRTFAFGDVGRQVDYRRSYVRRADGWKLLRHADDGEWLFDVDATPGETPDDDRLGEGLAAEDELAAALADHREEMAAVRSGARAVGEDEAMVEEHLADLGYK
jgi:arylsulfatase A-like enzyme